MLPHHLGRRLLALFVSSKEEPSSPSSAGLILLAGTLAGVFVLATPAAPVLARYLVMGAAMDWLAPAPGAASWQRGLWRVGVGVLALGLSLEVGTRLLEP